MSNIFTIADGLKYVEDLTKRLEVIQTKIRQTESTRITQRVISSAVTSNIVEQTEFTISPEALMSEYDKTSKEIRLVKQAIERANHSVDIGITPIF